LRINQYDVILILVRVYPIFPNGGAIWFRREERDGGCMYGMPLAREKTAKT